MIDRIVSFTRRLTNCRSNIKVFAICLISCYPACKTTCQSGNHTTILADQLQTKLSTLLGSRGGRNNIFKLRLRSCSKVLNPVSSEFLTSRLAFMHIVVFYMSNSLRKRMV